MANEEDRRSETEAFSLVSRRETHAAWFDHRARTTWEEISSLFSAPPDVVVRARGEMNPAAAGALAGTIAAGGMLATSSFLAHVSYAASIGDFVTGGFASGAAAFAIGLGLVLVTGAMVGASFAWVARRLRVLPAVFVLGLVTATASWILVHAVAMPRLFPRLAQELPFVPMTIAAAVFGALLALELPIRTLGREA